MERVLMTKRDIMAGGRRSGSQSSVMSDEAEGEGDDTFSEMVLEDRDEWGSVGSGLMDL